MLEKILYYWVSPRKRDGFVWLHPVTDPENPFEGEEGEGGAKIVAKDI